MGVGRAAKAVYELVEEPAPRRERARRMLVALVLGAISEGGSHTNPGGQRLQVVDRGSGQVVATWVERAGDDNRMLLRDLRSDLESATAEEFAARWVDRSDPSPSGPVVG